MGSALLSVSVLNILRAQSLRSTDFHDPGSVLTLRVDVPGLPVNFARG